MFAEDIKEVWEKTRDIDNPLSPWTEKYAADMNISASNKLSSRPSFEEVDGHYKAAKRIAIIGAVLLTLLLVVVWPCITIPFGSFSFTEFKHWVSLSLKFRDHCIVIVGNSFTVRLSITS